MGVVPMPSVVATKRSRSSLSRYHALRVQSLDSGGIPIFMCTRDLVARGKRSAPAEAARSGAGVRVCRVGWVPRGVVPTPSAGAFERSLNSRSSLPRATVDAPDSAHNSGYLKNTHSGMDSRHLYAEVIV